MALIDARDVLDPDGLTKSPFRGKIVGYFAPTGANSWDPYRFVSQDGEELEVLAGLKIQLEKRGPRFRMRQGGKVVRVEWLPQGKEAKKLASASPSARRARFLELCIKTFDEAAGEPAAVIASKLRG